MTGIRRLTKEELESLGYSRNELRQLGREHGVLVSRDALHHGIVRFAAAGVKLPPKQDA